MARRGEGCERLRDRVDNKLSRNSRRAVYAETSDDATVTTGPVERIQHGGASDRSHHQLGCPPTDVLPFPHVRSISVACKRIPQSSQWHQTDWHRAGQEVQCDRSRLQIGFQGKAKRDSDVAAMGQHFC